MKKIKNKIKYRLPYCSLFVAFFIFLQWKTATASFDSRINREPNVWQIRLNYFYEPTTDSELYAIYGANGKIRIDKTTTKQKKTISIISIYAPSGQWWILIGLMSKWQCATKSYSSLSFGKKPKFRINGF